MTPSDMTAGPLEGTPMDRLNDLLDDRAVGREVDLRSLDPALVETVDVVAMLGRQQAPDDIEARRLDQL